MERHTIQTHTDIESSGKVCGMETSHFIPILCALVFSITCFFILSISPGTQDVSMVIKILVGFSPLFLSIGYVAVFLIGRPPHFQEDFFENIFPGSHFNSIRAKKGKNPLVEFEP